MKRISLIMLALLMSLSGQAKELNFEQRELISTYTTPANASYFTIDKIEVEEVEDKSFDPKPITDSIGGIITVIDKMLVLGEKIVKIIEKGRAVVDVDLNSKAHVHIIPYVKGNTPVDTMFEMANWQAPKVKTYQVRYKNKLGQTVVSFEYSVNFQYGGTHNGTGSYIAGAHISASNVSVSWGYEFNASSIYLTSTNRGSVENPVAGLTLRVDYSVKTMLKSIQASESIHIDGFGKIKKLY